MHRTLLAIALSMTSMVSLAASDQRPRTPGFDVNLMRLLQPDWLFGQRTKVEKLVVTTKAVQDLLTAYAAAYSQQDSIDSCSIYLAVRTGQQLKTWTVCKGQDRSEIDAFIAAKIPREKIAPVNDGTLILSIHGLDSSGDSLDVSLTPSAWQQAAKGANLPEGKGLEMEQLVNLVWPR